MPPTPLPRPSAFADRIAGLIVRRRWLILGVALVATLLAGWRASKLELRTNFAELLPEKDPAVVVLREMNQRLTSLSQIVVVVQSPDPEANRRYVDDLVPRLRALKAPEITAVEWGVEAERAFFHHNKFLYASLEDLEDAYLRIRHEILRRKNPAFVDLGGGDKESLSAQSAEVDKKESDLLKRFPGGYYATKDRHVYAVVVRVATSVFGEHPGERLAARIHRLTEELRPARYHDAMTVGLTGGIVTNLEERQALEDDLIVATSICVALVCLVIFLFYGRLRALPFATVPAMLGVTFAMAVAQLAFGYLNSSTAFMGSIIVGNGINYAIIQMARYEEERRAGRIVRDAIAVALSATWRPTIIASLGAAIAYGSLAITSFRGFNQFGYIGGAGMVLSWLATVTVLPALWAVCDRRVGDETIPRVRGFAAARPLARLTVSRPRLLLGLAAVLSLAAIVPLPRYVRDPFEYDFRKLRNKQSRQSGAGKLAYTVDPIFGRSLEPSFVLADDPAEVEQIRRKLREKDAGYHILGEVKTINDFLPGEPALQQRKLTVLAKIRALVDGNLKLLDDRERADVLRLRPPDGLRVLTPPDLPMSVRRYFTEIDGTIGRPVVYYARHGVTVWDGRTQVKLAAVTQEVRLDDGRTVRSSGSAAIFAGMLNAIVRDGPIATAAALLGVALLVIILTWRRGGPWFILGTLALGVLWMVGAAAVAHVRINFLNFIALPITFGINVDYGVNLFLRYRLEGPGRVGAAVEAAGGAVALCSMTTIIGYGALLSADNQALQSFGAMAIIGEFACAAAALLILPATLVMLERRRARRAPAVTPAVAPAAEEPRRADGSLSGRG